MAVKTSAFKLNDLFGSNLAAFSKFGPFQRELQLYMFDSKLFLVMAPSLSNVFIGAVRAAW